MDYKSSCLMGLIKTITISTKISPIQKSLIMKAIPTGKSISEWLRDVAVSAAAKEHNNNRLKDISAHHTIQDMDHI